MASVIKAGNATNGIQITSDSTGILEIKTGTGSGTTAITVDANQAVSIGGNNISAVNSLGFRNRIINGDCRIDQRNNGASVTPTTSNTYVLDRWSNYISQASKYSVQRNAGSVTPPVGFTNYLGVTSLSAYSVGSSDYFLLVQNIEGFNIADLAWGTASAATVTLSFWVRSSLTGTFGGSLKGASGTVYSYPFTYTISSANTWEQKTITIAGPTAGTWTSDNTSGIQLVLGLGAGSTYSGTAGAWVSNANAFSATGASSVVGTNGATFYITGVQLEAGSVATPFERRDYGRELMMCQRYYIRYGEGLASGAIGMGLAGNTGLVQVQVFFPVQMRATPSIAFNSLNLTDHQTNFSVSNVAVMTSQTNSLVGIVEATTTGLTQYRAYQLRNNGTSGFLAYSAEL